MKITYSSELISNFKLADIVAPEKKFEALQSDTGCSLLFSVGTDDAFYVTKETQGHETGWVRNNLSKDVLAKHAGATVKTFSVAQNAGTRHIDMAMVIAAPDSDYLYLSLGNSATDTTWVATPHWDQVVSIPKIIITDVFVSQASDGEYIVVDVSRNPGDTVQYVERYYIDTNPAHLHNGEAWKQHAMAVDLDISRYTSCLGRRAGQKVDGIYTLGSIGTHDTLIFQPLYDRHFPDQQTNAEHMRLPAGSAPSSIAAVTMNERHETDLYVAGQGALYYFSSRGHLDGDNAIKVMDHPIFDGVTRLFAFATNTQVIIWGLNRAQQIFYTTCARDSIQSAAAWSYPLPILDQVENVSPYVDRASDGQVFFAHTGNGLFKKATRSIKTTTWKFDNILLPPLKKAKTNTKKFSSYTTRIQVTDDSNRPIGNVANRPATATSVTVSLSAEHRVGLYINNRYYVLTPTPLNVPVDQTGGLMIVEWVDNLEASVLHIHRDGQADIVINPMNKPLQQAALQLDTDDKLAHAVIRKSDGSVDKPLAGSNTPDNARKSFVQGMHKLAMAHKSLADKTHTNKLFASVDHTKTPLTMLTAGNVTSFAVSASGVVMLDSPPTHRLTTLAATEAVHSGWGDFVRWLKSLGEYVVHFIEDVVSKVWHFVVEIAGKVFRFVLDAVVKIVGALEAVFQWIKAAVEDVIKFLSFLFAWDDIVRTKNVFKKLITLSTLQAADDIGWIKKKFDGVIRQATDSLDDWAGLSHSSDWIKHTNSNQPASQYAAQTNLDDAHSTPSHFLTHHFTSNAHNSTFDESQSGGGADNDLPGMINSLLQAFESEKDVFEGFIHSIKTEAIDKFDSLSVAEILQRIVVRLLDMLLDTTKVVGDLMFDVIAQLVRSAIGVLDAKVYIPVLSEILEDVFGIAPFSILDVLCLIGAVPATIIYKIATGKAPFSANDGFSDKVIASENLRDLRARFGKPVNERLHPKPLHLTASITSAFTAADADDDLTNATPIPLDPEMQRRLFISGHAVSGILSIFVLPFITVADVDVEEGFSYSPNPVSTWAALTGIVASGTAGYARIFADPLPIKHEVFATMSTICTGCTIVSKIIHGATGTGYSWIKNDRTSEKFVTKLGSFWDGLFALIALAPTCYHFYELSQLEPSDDRSASFIGETSSVCSYLARIAEFGARMSPGQSPLKLGLMITMGSLYVCYGILQCAEAGVGGKPLPAPALVTI